MTLTKQHAVGLSLSGGGILTVIGGAIAWANQHLHADATGFCVDGLPMGIVAAIGSALTVLGTLRLLFSPNAAAKAAAAVLLFGCLATSTVACSQAQFQKSEQVMSDVLAGIQHGWTLAQIEEAVAKDLGFSGPVNSIVVTLVQDTIDELIALGYIPQNLLPTAVSMETQETTKLIKAGVRTPQAVIPARDWGPAHRRGLEMRWDVASASYVAVL